ncbi:MAG: BrnT family toxin [Anaerolineae bacterium]|nr:BrnT family toxin [Anaerolineae bacterium]
MQLQFEWDERKAELNLSKHRVSFHEAQTVFPDPLARIFDDELHSVGEPREIIIGQSSDNHLQLVCFAEREPALVRIISARRATRRERNDYEEYGHH